MTARRTTLRRLTRLGAALIVLTILTGVFGYVAVQRAQRNADDVRDDTVPALIELAAARGALIQADAAAVASFESGAVPLSGPGDPYREQIAIANQNLTEAATHDLRDVGSRLSLVNSLLSEYSGEIEQASASFRADEHNPQWAADLWQASQSLRSSGGVLALLQGLGDDQLSKLDDQVGGGAETVLSAMLWLVPAALLLILLVCTQVWLWRRFRRVANAGLAVATLLMAGVAVVTVLVFDTGGDLHGTGATAHRLAATWQGRLTTADTAGIQKLSALLDRECNTAAGGCGPTVQRATVAARSGGAVRDVPEELTGGSAGVQNEAVSATGHDPSLVLLPVGTGLAVLAVGFGLYRRFDEYWYRSG